MDYIVLSARCQAPFALACMQLPLREMERPKGELLLLGVSS